MARRPALPSTVEAIVAEMNAPRPPRVFDIDTFAAAAPERKSKRPVKRRDFSSEADRYVKETRSCIEQAIGSDDPGAVWASIKPEHLVALYAIMHEKVYGVVPHELSGEWRAAVSACGKLLRDEFAGVLSVGVEYLQWSFAQEKKAEARRAASGSESTWRLSWRQTFVGRKQVTDYRVAIERAHKRTQPPRA
jgi:hypothetical protein